MGQPLSRPGPGPAAATAGFSLVELMIAVAILAVLSVGATLSIGHRDRQAASAVALLRDSYEALRSEALLTGRPAVLRLAGNRLSRWTVGPDGERHRLGDAEAQLLRGEVRAVAGYGATGTAGMLEIHILPDRRSSAFEVALDGPGGGWICRADGWSALACAPRR